MARVSPATELALLLLCVLRACAADSPEEAALYNQVIGSGYNKASPPKNPNTNNSDVFLQLEVTFASDVNDRTLDFALHTWISFLWMDPRLNLTALNASGIHVLPDVLANAIWQPVVSFDRAGDSKSWDPPDIFARNDGYLLSHWRLTFFVHCSHEGTQPEPGTAACDFSIRLLYEADCKCSLIWVGDETSPFHGVLDSIIKNPEVRPLVSDLVSIEPTSPQLSGGLPVTGQTLVATFRFVKTSWAFFMSSYLPSTLTVLVSWMSFWVDVGSSASRIALGIACLLAISVQTGLGRIANPFGSQVRPGDVWTFMSTMMIFLTIVEFAVAHSAYREQAEVQEHGSGDPVSQPSYRLYKSPTSSEMTVLCDTATQTETSYLAFRATDLDELSKMVFPISFFIFSCLHLLWFAAVPE
ncbi:unnamed protein product [Ixodes hexagonus]